MARMVPPTIHSSVQSAAEKKIFNMIKNSRDLEGWVCLHSLGLARHETKRRGEIDFLLVGPLGVFVLEVKGGRVRREDGVWLFTNRYGEITRKHEGPFDQASSAMFSLDKELSADLPKGGGPRLLFAYGVAFPDFEYTAAGPDEAPELVFDLRDLRRPFMEYLQRLEAFARSREQRRRKRLTHEEVLVVTDRLRGDFDLRPSPDLELDDTRGAISELTVEQRAVLDSAERASRLVIDGPAGSGKTILAMEEARREARKGRRVLFLCFNRLLAARVRSDLRVENYAGSIEVSTYHAHCHKLIEGSSFAEEFRSASSGMDEAEVFRTLLPEFATMAALEYSAAPFDCLILDEAQDLLSSEILETLSLQLMDGLDRGRWRVFLDSNNQASVYGVFEDQVLDYLVSRCERNLSLTINCRNTRQIALQTAIVAEPRFRAAARVSGPPVDFRCYRSERQCLEQLKDLVQEFASEGIARGRISILVARSPSEELVRTFEDLSARRLEERDVRSVGTPDLEDLTWSTVSAFKGLENDIIIFVGIEDIRKDWWRGVTYVGMSRARVRLSVIVHDRCDRLRQERFAAEMERRSKETEMIA